MRAEGWESRLHEHFATTAPFAWGQNDCALWCADWVETATGRAFAPEWRGLYTTEAELTALMRARGYTTTEDIAARSGFPTVPVAFARRGDVVLHPQGCLGICDGLYSHFLTETGMTRLGTLKCLRAWAVD